MSMPSLYLPSSGWGKIKCGTAMEIKSIVESHKNKHGIKNTECAWTKNQQ